MNPDAYHVTGHCVGYTYRAGLPISRSQDGESPCLVSSGSMAADGRGLLKGVCTVIEISRSLFKGWF